MSDVQGVRRKYGWRRDLPSKVPWFDHMKLQRQMGVPPPVTDNLHYIKWVYDQMAEGSCTSNSGMGTQRFFRATHNLPDFDGSRQFLYYVTRSLEGSQGEDSGASIADTVMAEMKFGTCLEQDWPYSMPLDQEPNTVHP